MRFTYRVTHIHSLSDYYPSSLGKGKGRCETLFGCSGLLTTLQYSSRFAVLPMARLQSSLLYVAHKAAHTNFVGHQKWEIFTEELCIYIRMYMDRSSCIEDGKFGYCFFEVYTLLNHLMMRLGNTCVNWAIHRLVLIVNIYISKK